MNKIIGFNWKLNPLTEREAKRISQFSDKKGVIIFAPFVFLFPLKNYLKKAALGAQNVFWERKGAFTGEVSPSMLRNLGVKYALVGHSERRKYFKESNKMINKKIKAVLKENICPVLCVGESYSIKIRGDNMSQKYVYRQLKECLAGLKPSSRFIIAYEPIWAIGKGVSDNPQRSEKMISFIKKKLEKMGWKNVRIIYGGSVNSKNVRFFLESEHIDGVLVGGASLKESEISKILHHVSSH